MSREHEYKLCLFGRASDFIERAEPMLYLEEDRNATMIATANMIANQSGVFDGPFWYGVIEGSNSQAKACVMHSQPDGLLMTELPEAAGKLVYEGLNESIGPPARVVGYHSQARQLAERWQQEYHTRIKKEDSWEILRLDSVRSTTRAYNGILRLAGPESKEVIAQWGRLYSKEKPAFISIEDFFLKKLEREELFVLDDNGPKSMATVSARTRNGIRISAVFTPPAFRGRGYGKSIVSLLCEHLTSKGVKFITLSTRDGDDVKKMYQRLGFKRIGRKSSVTLEKAI